MRTSPGSTTSAATCAVISAITANGRTGKPKQRRIDGRDLASPRVWCWAIGSSWASRTRSVSTSSPGDQPANFARPGTLGGRRGCGASSCPRLVDCDSALAKAVVQFLEADRLVIASAYAEIGRHDLLLGSQERLHRVSETTAWRDRRPRMVPQLLTRWSCSNGRSRQVAGSAVGTPSTSIGQIELDEGDRSRRRSTMVMVGEPVAVVMAAFRYDRI